MADLKKIVEDLKSRIFAKETLPHIFTSDKASSPLDYDKHFPSLKRREDRNSIVKRPPLGGIAAPIPTQAPAMDLAQREELISQQIEDLISQRKMIRSKKSQRLVDEQSLPQRQPTTTQLRIVSIIQILSSRNEAARVIGSAE